MNLQSLFEPRSIAIVGAKPDARQMGGGLILSFLQRHGYAGHIYPVNPKYPEISGLQCYPDLASVPGPVDLAVVAVPAAAVSAIVESIPAGHVGTLLLPTSGFGELGEEGRLKEAEVVRLARERGIGLVGPNSVGIANLRSRVVASISQLFDRDDLPSGKVALVTQSGAFGTAILAEADRRGLGFGHFVSSGNEADLQFPDFGRYLIEREDVTAVCGYLESIRDGRSFMRFAERAAELGKPIVVLKVGTSTAGAEAARSHTGALAGSDAITQAVFDHCNVVRANDGEHLLDLVTVFSRTPVSVGRRLAVLSHSGGAGVMAADAAELAGAELPALSAPLQERLAALLPAFASVRNPVDMTGGASFQADLMADCLEAVLEDGGIDAAVLCVNLVWRQGERLLERLRELAEKSHKPFVVSWVAPAEALAPRLRSAPFPLFSDPARAARLLARKLEFDARVRSGAVRPAATDSVVARSSIALPRSVQAQAEVLRNRGLPIVRERMVASAAEAQDFQRALGGSVALKIASADIPHRTEIGAVEVGVRDPEAVASAYWRILDNVRRCAPEARIDGVLVQEMVQDGVEALVGVTRDPVFGPMIAVGVGGTLVELVRDARFLPAPISLEQALQAVEGGVLGRLLAGYRGQVPADAAALAEVVVAVSELAAEMSDLLELDLNPVRVLPRGQGCRVVDYKFRFESRAEPESSASRCAD